MDLLNEGDSTTTTGGETASRPPATLSAVALMDAVEEHDTYFQLPCPAGSDAGCILFQKNCWTWSHLRMLESRKRLNRTRGLFEKAAMTKIDPHTFYTREELIEMLKPLGINADGFISRIKPAKRFRCAWWGQDLIDAIEEAPRLGGHQVDAPALPEKNNGKSRRQGRNDDSSLAPLREIMTGRSQ